MTDIDPVTGGEVTWHPSPKQPDFIPPAGTVDAHCHVFGPAAEFPFAPERKYTPGDAGKDKLFGFFVGQVMKQSGGQANPGMVNQILKSKLDR